MAIFQCHIDVQNIIKEKINMLKESSFCQAIRTIKAISTIKTNAYDMVVIKIGCYLSQKTLANHAKTLGSSIFYTKSSIDGFGRFLPIPKQNYIVLFDLPLVCLFEFYELVQDDYVVIEVLMIKNCSKPSKIKQLIATSSNLLFDDIHHIKALGGELFFCGFDFDNPNFDSGIAKATYADFIPEPLAIYF